jgi:spore germination protein GerM
MTRRQSVVAAAVASTLVAAAFWIAVWLLAPPPPSLPADGNASANSAAASDRDLSSGPAEARIQATLYFLAPSGDSLAPEAREISFTPSMQEQAKRVVAELLRGSRRGLASPFPPSVELRELFITPLGLAFVDLSQEVVSNHPGGSQAEQLTVYSLANTLIVNFPAIKKVQLLVEGREVESLAGHLDLTVPYGRGPNWVQGRGVSKSSL